MDVYIIVYTIIQSEEVSILSFICFIFSLYAVDGKCFIISVY